MLPSQQPQYSGDDYFWCQTLCSLVHFVHSDTLPAFENYIINNSWRYHLPFSLATYKWAYWEYCFNCISRVSARNCAEMLCQWLSVHIVCLLVAGGMYVFLFRYQGVLNNVRCVFQLKFETFVLYMLNGLHKYCITTQCIFMGFIKNQLSRSCCQLYEIFQALQNFWCAVIIAKYMV